MVQDVRDIALSLDEVLTAYRGFQRITPDFHNGEEIVRLHTAEEAVVLFVQKPGTDEPPYKVVSKGIDVLKPMIRFCIENNIMLPRDGNKTILIEKDKIVLHIVLNLDVDLPASLSPMHISHLNLAKPKRGAATTV